MKHAFVVELAGQSVVCIGGGPVAAAKVGPLADCGAVVTVISPTCVDALAAVATWSARPYASTDLATTPPPRLVVAATGVAAVDAQVAADADALGVWCLRIDGRGVVSMPSVIRSGALLIALTTGAPALTRRLRQHLEATLGSRWGAAASVLSAARADPDIRAALGRIAPAQRRKRWRTAVDEALADGAQPSVAASRRTLISPAED